MAKTFNVGDIVNYHAIIGEGITSTGHTITTILPAPNNFGGDVAWISGKSGCVSLEALSNDEHPMQMRPAPKALTRSQKRYRAYLDSESGLSFFDWFRSPYWADYRRRCGV